MNNESMEIIKDLAYRKKWDVLNTILKSIYIPKGKSNILKTYVLSCFAYRGNLPAYREFVKKTKNILKERGLH